jgi:hypothetical protein
MENEKNKIEEAYERFDGFEKKLMSVEEITWNHDDEINARVHLGVLEENYGSERVQTILEQEGVDVKYLANHEAFLKIAEILKQ